MVTRGEPLTIWELMVLVAGAAVGFWLFGFALKEPNAVGAHGEPDGWVALLIGLLGGLSLVGPPLLLREVRRRRRPWGAGKVLWFSQGMASWLLWPPVVYRRIQNPENNGAGTAALCFMYGTPLMAIYITSAMLAGGWLRRRGRRRRIRRPYSWRERFGLLLAVLWACTGLYILSLIYREDFSH